MISPFLIRFIVTHTTQQNRSDNRELPSWEQGCEVLKCANGASHISPGRQPWEDGRVGRSALKERLNDAPLQGGGVDCPAFPELTPWANMTSPFQGKK